MNLHHFTPRTGRSGAQRTRDRGNALPMALVFLTLGALVVTALLTFAITLFRNRPPLEERSDSLEAVRSGMRMAITMQRAYGPGGCFPTTSGEFSDINGRDVQIACSVLEQADDEGGRLALLSTSNVGKSTRANASIAANGNALNIVGTVMVNGGNLGVQTVPVTPTGEILGSTVTSAQTSGYRYGTRDPNTKLNVAATPACAVYFGPQVLSQPFAATEFALKKGVITPAVNAAYIQLTPDAGSSILGIVVTDPSGSVMLDRKAYTGGTFRASSTVVATPALVTQINVCYQSVPNTNPTWIPSDRTTCGSPLMNPSTFTGAALNCQAGTGKAWWNSAGWRPTITSDYVYPMLPQIPTYPRSTVPIAVPGATNCYVYYPGRYSGDITLNGDKDYYFASGVYYFDGKITISGGARVVGGQGEFSGCSFDADAAFLPGSPRYHEITGYGVTWLLGGRTGALANNGRIVVQDSSLRLNNRVATNSTRASADISVMTVNLATPNPTSGQNKVEIPWNDRVLLPGCLASEVSTNPACAKDISTYSITPVVGGTALSYTPSGLTHDDYAIDVQLGGTQRAKNQVLIGGAVFTPNAGVKFTRPGTNNGYKINVDGGITATTMEFDIGAAAAQFQIGKAAQPVYQRVKLNAVTSFGGRAFRSTVELEVDNAKRYAINSWTAGGDTSAGPAATTTTAPTTTTSTTTTTAPVITTTTTVPIITTTTTSSTTTTSTTTTTVPIVTTTTVPIVTTTTTTLPPSGYNFCTAAGNTSYSTNFGPGLWSAYHWKNRTMNNNNDGYATDSKIDVNFGTGANPVINRSDNFSILWHQKIQVATACTIKIRAGGDDGFAVRIDGNWEILEWRDQSFMQTTATITLTPGYHDFEFYFYEKDGNARALFEWKKN